MTKVRTLIDDKAVNKAIYQLKPGDWFEYRDALFFIPRIRMKDENGNVVIAMSHTNDAVITSNTHCKTDIVRVVRGVLISEE